MWRFSLLVKHAACMGAVICGCSQAMAEVEEASRRDNDNKRVEEARRARVEWLESLRRNCDNEEEFHTARTQPIWTQSDSSSSCCSSSCTPQGLSPADLERIHEENRLDFQHLVHTQGDDDHPAFPSGFGFSSKDFFEDFGGKLEAGEKIGGGGQADIHEAIYDGKVREEVVLKVFRSDYLLVNLQRTWTKGIAVEVFTAWDFLGKKYTNCCGIKQGTLLQDGRFAFLLQRCWGDLRKAIDVEIVKDKTHQRPPFSLSATMHIMVQIALGMRTLHEKDILHKDLKATNCLLLYHPRFLHYSGNHCLIADYESSEGVVGTGFWRAPEILAALKNEEKNISSTHEVWTKMMDVYSYAMTCYEVLTGCIPFENCVANDYDGVIGGERPPMPDYVNPKLQALVRRCWHSEPSMRPTFEEIPLEIQKIYPEIILPIDVYVISMRNR